MNTKERKILEDAGFIYPSVVTNADRIRAMSDEELALLLQPICPPNTICKDKPPHDCRKCVLNWLRKEKYEV